MEQFKAIVTSISMLWGSIPPEAQGMMRNPMIPIVSDQSAQEVPMIIFFKSVTHGTLKTNPKGAGFDGLQQDIQMCKGLSLAGHCEGGEDVVVASYESLSAEIAKRKQTD